MNKAISLNVKGNPEYMQVCSSVAISAANIAGFDIDTVDEIGMAVFEGCKMISCHGSNCWCKEYRIDIDIKDENFIVMMETVGEFCIEKTKNICTMCPKEGDLGLAIINSVMDEATFDTNEEGNRTLVMKKAIKNI